MSTKEKRDTSTIILNKILSEMKKSPLLFLQIWCIPPILLSFVRYILGSMWPIFFFFLGVICTIVGEVMLILWYFNEEQSPNLNSDGGNDTNVNN